jgi:biotin carboxylase
MKPLILVISNQKNLPQNSRFTSLINKYDFIFYLLKKETNLSQQLEELTHNTKNKPDAIISFNDDTCLFASIVASELDLIGPTPQSLARTQNKESFSKELREKKYLPETTIVGLTNLQKLIELDYPIFIKPTKGALSEGALKIGTKANSRKIVKRALKSIHINTFEKSYFKKYLPNLNLRKIIVQPYIEDRQYTLDGFVYNNEITFLGVTESIYDKNKKSFVRFDFPIIFNQSITNKLNNISNDIFQNFSFNNSFFNLEFFISKTNKINIIELNTRPAIVFDPFYSSMYQQSLTEMMIKLALGYKPKINLKNKNIKGKSFILRKYQDYLITNIPSQKQIETILKKHNQSKIRILCKKSNKLSDQRQDSYSYRYAIIDICGKTNKEINEKFQNIKQELKELITFSPISD